MIHRHLFLLPEILSRLIFTQSDNGDFYVQATQQQKPRRAFPEEIIRQLFVLSLIHSYGYPENRLRLEFSVQMGRATKRADIVVLDQNGVPYIIVEVKQELDQIAIDQLNSYVTITRASFGVAVSADKFHCINNNGVTYDDLPIFGESTNLFENNHPNPTIKNETPQLPFEIDSFERISPTHVKITIQGHKTTLSNLELDSYRKFQRHFLAKGVVLKPEIRQQEWRFVVSRLLSITPITIRQSWAWNIEMTLSEIASGRFNRPYKYEVINVNGFDVPSLLIRLGHIIEHIEQNPVLLERKDALPIKSPQALRKQLTASGVIIKDGIERIIDGKRVAHMDALSISRMETFGLYLSGTQ